MKSTFLIVGSALLMTVTSCGSMMEPPSTIAGIVASDANFSTLKAALAAAGLTETLNGTGPYTVFAPTNAAFAKLPPGTVDNLLKPENKAQLTAILLFHVVSGKVPAADVVTLTSAKTLNGASVSIAVSGGTVTLNGNSTVTKTDVPASNGVIHVIDTVLLPPS